MLDDAKIRIFSETAKQRKTFFIRIFPYFHTSYTFSIYLIVLVLITWVYVSYILSYIPTP